MVRRDYGKTAEGEEALNFPEIRLAGFKKEFIKNKSAETFFSVSALVLFAADFYRTRTGEFKLRKHKSGNCKYYSQRRLKCYLFSQNNH